MKTIKINRFPYDAGRSGWQALSERILPQPQELEGNFTADYLIIGAGFAGVSAARRLHQIQPKAKIVIVDAKLVAEGASGRNSGFMIDLPHHLASGSYSSDEIAKTKEEIAQNRAAIQFASDAVDAYNIPKTAFARSGKTNGAASPRGEAFNAAFMQSLKDCNEKFETLDAKSMKEYCGSDFYLSGLHTPGAVIIQPAIYMQYFAAGVKSIAQIYENSPVVSLQKQGKLWTATTPKGSITAAKVILGVNGYIEEFGQYKGKLIHIIAYASMTRAITRGELGQFGEDQWGVLPADSMGATLRKISGRSWERFVIRTRYSYNPTMGVSQRKFTQLVKIHRRSFDRRFPKLANLPFEYSWTGKLCLSRNHAPGFGEVEEGLYSACVENGLGSVKSTLAGMLAAELASGTNSKILTQYLQLPSPSIIPPQPLANIAINSYIRYLEFKAGIEG